MRLPPSLLLRAAFAAAIFTFAPAATCDGGLRDQNDGVCPAGEICDEGTPDGLVFVAPLIGEGFFDSGEVKTMATGGTQTVQLDTEAADGTLSPFTLPFVGTVDGNTITIASETANVIVLRAHSAASGAYLRITDPANDELYDEVAIASADLAQVSLTDSFARAIAGSAAADGDVPLFAPGAQGIVGLASETGIALVDDSLVLAGPGVTQRAWDEFTVGNVAPGAYELTATSAGHPFTLGYEVGAAPDRVDLPFGGDSLQAGAGELLCFTAYAGARFMYVPWTVTATGADVATTAFAGCFTVTPAAAGPVVLHVHAGTLAVDRTLQASGATSALRSHLPGLAGTPGERALAVRP